MASSTYAFHDEEQKEVLSKFFSAQDTTTSNADLTSIQTVPLLTGPRFEGASEPNVPIALRNVSSGLPSEPQMQPLAHEESSSEHTPAFSPSDHSVCPVAVPLGSLPSRDNPVSVTKSFQVFRPSILKTSVSIPDSLVVPKSASPTSVGLLPISQTMYGKQVRSNHTEPSFPTVDAGQESLEGIVSLQEVSVTSDASQTGNESFSSRSSLNASNISLSSQHVRSPSFTSTPFLSSIPAMPAHVKPLSGTYSTTTSEKSFVSDIPAVFRQDTAPSEVPMSSVTLGGKNTFEARHHRSVVQEQYHQDEVKTTDPHPQLLIGKLPGKPVRSLKKQILSTQHQQPFTISQSSSVLPEVCHSKSISGNGLSIPPPTQAEDDVARLMKEVRELRQAKANLEGQLEGVVSECQSTLQERSLLYSKLAKTQVELHALQDISHQQPNQKQDDSTVDGNTSLEDEMHRLETSLLEKKRELTLLHKQLETERDRIGKLGNELVESKRKCAAKAHEVKELHDMVNSLKQSCEAKVDEVNQLTQNVTTTEANLKRVESSKVWLHNQLQEAVQAKLQLQEEVRTARATSIAQSIQLNQLQKENNLYQEQIDDLHKNIFKDKAKLVSELEVIEADVALNQDTFAKMEAEKVHTEQMLSLKMQETEKLGEELAEEKARNAELEWKLSEAESHGNVLLPQLQAAEHEKEILMAGLQQQQGILDDRRKELDQLRRTKLAQQENIRQLETTLVDKEGLVQKLKDSSQVLQHELKAVKEAKESVEDELVQAAEAVALMETKLSGAQAETKKAKVEVRSAQQQLKEQESAIENLLHQVSRKEQELSEQGVALSSLETQSQGMKSQFESLQQRFGSMVDESERSIDEKECAVQHLVAELDKARSELEDLKADNGKMSNQIEKLLEENAHQSGQLESIASGNTLEDFQKLLDEKAVMESELGSLRASRQHDMLKSQGKMHRLETELRDCKRKADQEAKELGKKLEQSQDQLQELQEALSKAEIALQEARAKTPVAIIPDTDEKKSLEHALQQKEDQFQQVLIQTKKLERENEDLKAQLEEEVGKVVEVERASSLVAQQLKQNAAKVEQQLHSEIHALVLDGERLKGRLVGITTAQQCTRQHASALEMALAQKETQVTELETKMNSIVQEKEAEALKYQEQLSNLQDKESTLKAEVELLMTNTLLEKQELEMLERRLAEKDEELSYFTATAATEETAELKRRTKEVEQLSNDLQIEVKAMKHQVELSHANQESLQRELQEKTSVSTFLQEELQLSQRQTKQAREELKQLQQYLSTSEKRKFVEVDPLVQAMTDAPISAGVSGFDETDKSLPKQPTPRSLSDAYKHDSIYEAQLQEMSSRVEKARYEGKESAERLCQGEISVLRSKLGSKSKALGSLQSCLSSLRHEMNQMQQRMGDHSASLRNSQLTTRQLESKIERLQHLSSGDDSSFPGSSPSSLHLNN